MRRVSRDQVVFDTFRRFSARSLYTWALPMGSRLYSGREVRSLLDGTDLNLANAEHDWIGPYGLYREIPNTLASGLRKLDTALGSTPVGMYLASVSYWHAQLSATGR